MEEFKISPSGIQILTSVASEGDSSIPELASRIRLTPKEVQVDIANLVAQGWTKKTQDNTVVITVEGQKALRLAKRNPSLYVFNAKRPLSDKYIQ